jgi:hypothetical protein
MKELHFYTTLESLDLDIIYTLKREYAHREIRALEIDLIEVLILNKFIDDDNQNDKNCRPTVDLLPYLSVSTIQQFTNEIITHHKDLSRLRYE